MRLVATSMIAALALAAAPVTASAQERPGGLAVEGALGINGVTSDEYFGVGDALQVDPLIGLGASAFYRLHRYASVGLSMYYAFLYAHSEAVSGTYAGFFSVAAAGRAHVTLGRLEPYVTLGLGYATNHTSGEYEVLRGTTAFGLDLHGAAIDLSLGLWISVTDRISVGPFARFVFALWAKGCPSFTFGDLDEQGCDGMDDLYPDPNPSFPHLWIVGAQVSYHLLDGPMVRRREIASGASSEADGSLGGHTDEEPGADADDASDDGSDAAAPDEPAAAGSGSWD